MTTPNVAVVTGGSSGIGWEICRQMLDLGYEVVSVSLRAPPQSHAKLHSVEVDLMDAAATAQAAADVAQRFAVTHVVHNAGVIRPALLPDVKLDDLDALTQLHLGAAITLVQAVLSSMKKNHFGRIVLISSRAALGLPTRTVYSATKAGMIGMARTWALELAPDGITVNVVAPCITETDSRKIILERPGYKEWATDQALPAGRWNQPEDLVGAVLFLCSPLADMVVGHVLMVDGGWTIQ